MVRRTWFFVGKGFDKAQGTTNKAHHLCPPAHRTSPNGRKSNLAFALACLPRQTRIDMSVFYAFCRVVDDIADDPDLAVEEKRAGLRHWDQIVSGEANPTDELEIAVDEVFQRYNIDRDTAREIIRGMEMDLDVRRYKLTTIFKPTVIGSPQP